MKNENGRGAPYARKRANTPKLTKQQKREREELIRKARRQGGTIMSVRGRQIVVKMPQREEPDAPRVDTGGAGNHQPDRAFVAQEPEADRPADRGDQDSDGQPVSAMDAGGTGRRVRRASRSDRADRPTEAVEPPKPRTKRGRRVVVGEGTT